MFVFENTLFRMISDANISKILILHINFQSFFCIRTQKSVILTQISKKKMYLIHPNCQNSDSSKSGIVFTYYTKTITVPVSKCHY